MSEGRCDGMTAQAIDEGIRTHGHGYPTSFSFEGREYGGQVFFDDVTVHNFHRPGTEPVHWTLVLEGDAAALRTGNMVLVGGESADLNMSWGDRLPWFAGPTERAILQAAQDAGMLRPYVRQSGDGPERKLDFG